MGVFSVGSISTERGFVLIEFLLSLVIKETRTDTFKFDDLISHQRAVLPADFAFLEISQLFSRHQHFLLHTGVNRFPLLFAFHHRFIFPLLYNKIGGLSHDSPTQ